MFRWGAIKLKKRAGKIATNANICLLLSVSGRRWVSELIFCLLLLLVRGTVTSQYSDEG
jgi:hypothetical protein